MFRVRKSKLQALAAAATLAAPMISMGQAVNATWTFSGSGGFNSNVGIWQPAVPSGGGIATLQPTTPLVAPANATFSAAVTLGGLNFNGPFTAGNYFNIIQNPGATATMTFNAGSTVNITDGVGTMAIAVVAPNFYKAGNGTIVMKGTNSFASGVTVTGGRLTMATSFSINGALIVGTANNGVLETNGGNIGFLSIGSPGAPGGSIINTAGNLNGSSGFVVQTGTVTVNGGQVSLSGSIFDGDVSSINGFNKAGAGLMVMRNAVLNGTLGVKGGTLRITQQSTANVTASTTHVKNLTIAGTPSSPTATLDITNQSVVIDSGNVDDIRAQLLSGRGAAGFANETWTGTGIQSSTLAASGDLGFAIGYARNGDLPLGSVASFGGVAVNDDSILIKYTRAGDTDLNGVVDDNDVTVLGAFYDPGGSENRWSYGDVDYSGAVDDGDVTLIGAFYDPLATPLSQAFLASQYGSEFANAFEAGLAMNPAWASTVPEPTTLGLLGIVAGSTIIRRLRRS